MRVSFNEIFQDNGGVISPKMPVSINGIIMSLGVSFTVGVSFGGIDITTLRGRDIEGNNEGGIFVITGHY